MALFNLFNIDQLGITDFCEFYPTTDRQKELYKVNPGVLFYKDERGVYCWVLPIGGEDLERHYITENAVKTKKEKYAQALHNLGIQVYLETLVPYQGVSVDKLTKGIYTILRSKSVMWVLPHFEEDIPEGYVLHADDLTGDQVKLILQHHDQYLWRIGEGIIL